MWHITYSQYVWFLLWSYLVSLRKAYCLNHKRECDLMEKVAMFHIAGTPCTAWSPAGLTDGEAALSHAHFLGWAGVRSLVQEPVIGQEYTPQFPRELFPLLLPQYSWSFAILDPHSYGWPVRRARQIALFLWLNLSMINMFTLGCVGVC